MIKNDDTAKEDPEPNWEEFQDRVRLYHYYANLPNTQLHRSEKWIGLKSLGYSNQECKKMCKPRETDMEEVLREVSAISRRELRSLVRKDREERAAEKSTKCIEHTI